MSKNRLDFSAQLSRHDHDVSAGYTSSITTGPIVPQFYDVLGPGDTIYYRTHLFARLQDVVTAFIGEIDLHVDYFFVPLQMIYTPFGQIFAQTDDYLSSCYKNINAHDDFPTISESAFIGRPNNNSRVIKGHTECFGKESARLLDALDANPYLMVGSTARSDEGYTDSNVVSDYYCRQGDISPWLFGAYQAIYQKYYRNDSIERFSIDSYNYDEYYTSGARTSDLSKVLLRYIGRPNDYFTSVRVSPIASSVNKLGASGNDSFLPDNGDIASSLLYKVNDFLGIQQQEVSPTELGKPLGYNSPLSFNNSSTSEKFNVGSGSWFGTAQSIRTLFAVDKFARIWGRADKTYDDQILAHFGIKIPHDVKHDITKLASYRVALQSDPIYSTANVPDSGNSTLISSLGQVGGQGQCNLDTDTDKFTAPVHGVFMAVMYALTKPRYFGTFSKLHHLDNRLKFPIPEFDKLGAQPLYDFESNPVYLYGSRTFDDGNDHNTREQFEGWTNRYQEFKRKYNRVSMTYVDPTALGGFIQYTPDAYNIYAPWTISRSPLAQRLDSTSNRPQLSKFVSGADFFESCRALDDIMVTRFAYQWDNNWFKNPHLMFQTDPIITDFMCFAKKVSWMSETGEADL